jgi:hypothetical protein
MTLETPQKAAMAPCSGKKRDRLSDYTNQLDASPNPKDLKFLGTGDNGEKIGSNGKDPIKIEDSPPKAEETLTVFKEEMVFEEERFVFEEEGIVEDESASAVKITAYRGLDEEVKEEDEMTPVPPLAW